MNSRAHGHRWAGGARRLSVLLVASIAVANSVQVAAYAHNVDDEPVGEDGGGIEFVLRKPHGWLGVPFSTETVSDGIVELHATGESSCPPHPTDALVKFRLVRKSDGSFMGSRDLRCRGYVEAEWTGLASGRYSLEARKVDGNRSPWFWQGHIPDPEDR